MDYSFCGFNWDCWYAWAWSSPTAAWVQGLATLGLLYVTWRTWRHDWEQRQIARDKEESDRHQADMLNLEKIIQYMAICAELTEQLLDDGEKNHALSAAKVKANQTQLRGAADELSWFIRRDRSHPQVTSTVMGFLITCLQLSLAFDAILAKLNRQAHDEIAAYTATLHIDKPFTDNLRDSKKQMEDSSALIAMYRRRFNEDRDAAFPARLNEAGIPEEA